MTLAFTGEKDLESPPVYRQNRDMASGVLYTTLRLGSSVKEKQQCPSKYSNCITMAFALAKVPKMCPRPRNFIRTYWDSKPTRADPRSLVFLASGSMSGM